jgi:hypothetical protein
VTAAAARDAAAISLVLALAGLGCQRGASTLLVEVTSDGELTPASLQATVSADTRAWTEGVSGELVLPVGVEIPLPADVIGPVTVAVDAFDGQGGWLAGGVTEQAHINPGGDTTVVVRVGEDGMERLP